MSTKINMPPYFSDKIGISDIVPLSDNEWRLFGYCLLILEKQMRKENISIEDIPPVQVIFSKDMCFEYKCSMSSVNGAYMNIIVYHMDNLRVTMTNNEFGMIEVFLHEFCHFVWRIVDENKTIIKVRECLNTFGMHFE